MPLMPAVRILVFIFLVAISLTAFAQVRPPDNRQRNCSISGRVTIGGQLAAGVQVTILEVKSNNGNTPQRDRAEMESFKVTTDSDGAFSVTAMAAGQYRVATRMPAYVPANDSLNRNLGKNITLDDGEAREGVNFALVRGGVITGRVTNAEGKPLIRYTINPARVDEQRRTLDEAPFSNQMPVGEMLETDDRGVYRLYGLHAGRYLLSVGDSRGFRWMDDSSGHYQRTYPPSTTDPKLARIIEVTEGSETTHVDIQMGLSNKTFEVAGRLIDADTGQPIPDMSVNAFSRNGDGGVGNGLTDTDGNFRVTGLVPGKYQMQATSVSLSEGSDYYFEQTVFEIIEGDVSGIEMKGARGGTVSGSAVIEGNNDPAIKAQIKKIYVNIDVRPQSSGAYSRSRAEIKDDGSFRARGIATGMARFNMETYTFPALKLLRIERNGAEVKDTFEIGKGEQVTGVRLVFAYGNGSIRGEVKLAGGQLPDGWALRVEAWRDGKQQDNDWPNDKGRFALTNLLEGEYDVKLSAQSIRPNTQNQHAPFGPVVQRVVVPKGGEVQVAITADLSGKQEER